MICNKRQLADVFGVSEETLTRWAKLGCPVEEKRRGTQGNRYDTGKVYAWRLALAERSAEPADLENERTMLVRVQRELAELNLAERRDELVDVAAVQSCWSDMAAAMRTRTLLIPPMGAGLCVHKPAGEIEAILRQLVHEALSELSDDGVPK